MEFRWALPAPEASMHSLSNDVRSSVFRAHYSGGLPMLGRTIIGGVCLSLMLLTTTQVAAQTQPPPQSPGALPQRPRPPAPAPTVSPYCMLESKEYSLGAVLCVSSQMSEVCTAPDSEHSHSWWSSGPQPLCSSATSAHTPATAESTEAPPARARSSPPAQPTMPNLVQPTIPAQPPNEPEPAFPKTQP